MSWDDNEILKRLAEIEGWEHCGRVNEEHGDDTFYVWLHDASDVVGWNPLINDADCMALLKKYMGCKAGDEWHIEYEAPWEENGETTGQWHVIYGYLAPSYPLSASHKSLNHAICRAVIESR